MMVKYWVETSGLAVIVMNTVEGSRVWVTFKSDVSAGKVMTPELRYVVTTSSDETNVDPGRVVVSIWVSLIVKVRVSGGLDVVNVRSTFEVAVTVW